MSELTLAEQQKDLQQILHSLKGLIENLPLSVPCGAKDRPIGQYFPENAEHNEEEGPYFTFNKACNWVFQGLTDPARELLVMRQIWHQVSTHLHDSILYLISLTALAIFSSIFLKSTVKNMHIHQHQLHSLPLKENIIYVPCCYSVHDAFTARCHLYQAWEILQWEHFLSWWQCSCLVEGQFLCNL